MELKVFDTGLGYKPFFIDCLCWNLLSLFQLCARKHAWQQKRTLHRRAFVRKLPRQNTTYWVCSRCAEQRWARSSYINILSYLQTAHFNEKAFLESEQEANQAKQDGLVLMTFGTYIWWLENIINGLLPFQSLQYTVMPRHRKHPPISLSFFPSSFTLFPDGGKENGFVATQ